VPADPFTGKPLVYKPARGGFKLYSADVDMKDDDGDPEKDRIVEVRGGKLVLNP